MIIAGIVALLVIFIRGSFDAGEPIDTMVRVASIVSSGVLLRLWERSAHQFVRARRA